MGPDPNRDDDRRTASEPAGDFPPSPLTPTGEGATQLHELFMTYVAAGFTRPEALGICLAQLIEMMRWGHERDGGA